MKYHIPENEQLLDNLFAVISKDETGEGICAMMTPSGGMPMVFGHERMLEMTKKFAKQIAKETGKELRIVKYSKTEVLEVIKP